MKCQQTISGSQPGEYDWEICGKTAYWITPNGKPVCGIHRRAVDRFHARTKTGMACTPCNEEEQQ